MKKTAPKPAPKVAKKPAPKAAPAKRAAAPKAAKAVRSAKPAKTARPIRAAKPESARSAKPAKVSRVTQAAPAKGPKAAKAAASARPAKAPLPQRTAKVEAPAAPASPRGAAVQRKASGGAGKPGPRKPAGPHGGRVQTAPPIDQESFRGLLLQKREELLAMYRNDLRLGQEASDGPTEDIVDRANNSYTRELSFSISDAERTRVLQIDAALGRIEKGSFGRCGHCSREIPVVRLEALPWANLCVECQELLEKGLLADA
ncbi:MAG: TraR/DksA family transcriptional regulator [Thermoanaerobaculia bacterium]|nr:TraR/DksA family transcriptional regulator [Thermoanaerobaculia bacterium]